MKGPCKIQMHMYPLDRGVYPPSLIVNFGLIPNFPEDMAELEESFKRALRKFMLEMELEVDSLPEEMESGE